jgi:osmotically inducible protein OsmC
MATIERHADAVWEGGLANGSGRVSGASGAFRDQPVTWASRVESSDGRTSPEELIAAAHASCFSMALSHQLGQGGATPERLQVRATTSLERDDAGIRISAIHLTVTGRVPGMDAAGFEKAAQAAGTGCPVSQALKAVPISVDARLE